VKRFLISLLVMMLFMPVAMADELTLKEVHYQNGKYLIVEALVERSADSGELTYTVPKYGVIDFDGNTIVEPLWDACYVFDEGMMCFESYDREVFAIYNADGELVSTFPVPEEADCIEYFKNGYALIEVDGLWGYMDMNGEIIIEPKYEMDTWAGFEPDYYFDEKYNFSEGLAAVCLDGKIGYIDINGEEVIPFVFDEAYMFEDGQARVFVKNSSGNYCYGVIDTAGNWVISPEWDSIWKLENGTYNVYTGDKEGVIGRNGEQIMDAVYDWIYYDGELNGYIFRIDGEEGVLYSDGNTIMDYDDDGIVADSYPIGNGYREFRSADPVVGDYRLGVIAANGDVIAEPVYSEVGYCSGEMINVCKDDKWGYIDTEGNVVVDFIYDNAWDFCGGIAAVELDDKIGFIDVEGNVVLDFVWNECGSYWREGLGDERKSSWYEYNGEYRLAVRKGTVWHIIDNYGNVIK